MLAIFFTKPNIVMNSKNPLSPIVQTILEGIRKGMRSIIGIVLIWGILLSCKMLAPIPTQFVTTTQESTSTRTPTTSPTWTATPRLSATRATTPIPIEQDQPYEVHFHPEGGLFVGDIVSAEIIGAAPDNSLAFVSISGKGYEKDLGQVKFEPFGIGGRIQATYNWAWNTDTLTPGTYTVTVRVQHQNQNESWTVPLVLQPSQERPEGKWAQSVSECCTIFYVTNTAAELDIQDLTDEAERQAQQAVQDIGVAFTDPITVTLLPRVLGHGGFATEEISISYLDRNYASNRFGTVLHHEMIHILDGRMGGDYRPSLFVEGLAVYLTGGHFKPEPLFERAAALLQIEDGSWYIPLKNLADDFYQSQHEIGYLQGGALVGYMIDRWGWQKFNEFYRGMQASEDGLPSTAIDTALKLHFDLSFKDLEADFLRQLQRQEVNPAQKEDLRLTVIYFDSLRHYQRLFDPSAYFATAWLQDNVQMRQRGITADYLRHPIEDTNLALETMLITAYQALDKGNYQRAEAILNEVENTLVAFEDQNPDPWGVSSLASDYLTIVQFLRSQGLTPQHIEVTDNRSEAWVGKPGEELAFVRLDKYRNGWGFAQ